MKTHEYEWIPFVLFVSITMFVVVELIITALVEGLSKMEQLEMADSAETSMREGAATAPLLRDDDRGARDADQDDNRPHDPGHRQAGLRTRAVRR